MFIRSHLWEKGSRMITFEKAASITSGKRLHYSTIKQTAMEILKCLDDLLAILYANTLKTNEGRKEIEVDKFISDHGLYRHEDFTGLMKILIADEYAMTVYDQLPFDTDVDFYKKALITVQGIHFYETQGGYGKQETKKTEAEDRSVRNETTLANATVWLALATVAIGISSVLEIWKFVANLVHSCPD